jgi:cell division initiation protein
MFLSPPEIQQQKLKSRLGSYDREDVDYLLDDIVASYEQVWRERDELRERVGALERELDRFKEFEHLLRDSLLTGQRAAEEVRSEAEKQAEALLDEAREKATQIVREASSKRDGIKAEIGRMESVEREVQARCRALLVGALEALENGEASGAPQPASRSTKAAE